MNRMDLIINFQNLLVFEKNNHIVITIYSSNVLKHYVLKHAFFLDTIITKLISNAA